MTGPAVFTAGHGNRTPEELLALLAAHGVGQVADVRRFPASRRHPHFARPALEAALAAAGLAYRWEGEALGGFRKPRPASPHTALRSDGFRAYADHMETPAFREAVDRLLALAREKPTAILCAERLPWRCHRSFLSDTLAFRGARVVHLLDPGQAEEHRPSPLARPEGDRLVYDRPEPGQLELGI